MRKCWGSEGRFSAACQALSARRRDHADDRPDRSRGIVATVQVRRIEARYGAVEVERVRAIEPVAEQLREIMKSDGFFGYCEDDLRTLADADAIAYLRRGAGWRNLGMNAAIENQHRT